MSFYYQLLVNCIFNLIYLCIHYMTARSSRINISLIILNTKVGDYPVTSDLHYNMQHHAKFLGKLLIRLANNPMFTFFCCSLYWLTSWRNWWSDGVSLTSGYHPQANGQIEWANKEISYFFRTFSNSNLLVLHF